MAVGEGVLQPAEDAGAVLVGMPAGAVMMAVRMPMMGVAMGAMVVGMVSVMMIVVVVVVAVIVVVIMDLPMVRALCHLSSPASE